jgi:hypothetical protein
MSTTRTTQRASAHIAQAPGSRATLVEPDTLSSVETPQQELTPMRNPSTWETCVLAAVGGAQFVRNVAARLAAVARYREYRVLEALAPLSSCMLAGYLLFGKSLLTISSAYAGMLHLMPQRAWGVVSGIVLSSSLTAFALSAAENSHEAHARVAALALHAFLFGMLGTALVVSGSGAIATCFVIPLFVACVVGCYRVGQLAHAP